MKPLYPYFIIFALCACQNAPQVATPSQEIQEAQNTSAANATTVESETTETIQISARLDLSEIEPELHEEIRKGFKEISLVSKDLGNPLSAPLFAFSQTGSLDDFFTFNKVPKGHDFTLSTNNIFINSESECSNGVPLLYSTAASQEVKAPMSSLQLTLKLEKVMFQQDLVTLEQTEAYGTVTDSNGSPLEKANIEIQALALAGRENDPCFTAVFKASSDAQGNFSFMHLYAGHQLKMKVTTEGFIGQERVIILSSNKQGDPQVNRFDFELRPGSEDASSPRRH